MSRENSHLVFHHHLKDLHQFGSFCDIRIQSGGRTWPLHRVALARHSPRFLTQDTDNVNLIRLDDNQCPEEAVDTVIRYIYGERISRGEDMVVPIMATAASLGIRALVSECVDTIRTLVSTTGVNPLKYLAVAKSHGTPDLVDFLMEVSSSRMQEVVGDRDEFAKLSADDVCKLIKGKQFDKCLLRSVIAWMEIDPEVHARDSRIWENVDLKVAGLKELDRLHDLKIPGALPAMLKAYRNFSLARMPIFEKNAQREEWPELEEPSLVAIGGNNPGEPTGTSIMILSFRVDFPFWRPLPSLPSHQTHEYFPHIHWVDGKIFVFGGCSEGNSVTVYLPKTREWRPSVVMPRTRRLFASAILGGIVYVIGGATKTRKSISQVDKFDPKLEEWSPSHHLPVPLTGSSCCTHRGTLYTAGGFVWQNEEKLPCSVVYRMDNTTGMWSAYSKLPMALLFPSVTSVCDDLYIFGGAIKEPPSNAEVSVGDIYRMDTATRKWIAMGQLRQARHGSSAVTLGERVYIAAGACSQFGSSILSTVECWDTRSRKLRTLGPATNFPCPQQGMSVCGITDHLSDKTGKFGQESWEKWS